MPELTMEQLAKVKTFAIAMAMSPQEVIDALQSALGMGIALGVPVDDTEELFFLIGDSDA